MARNSAGQSRVAPAVLPTENSVADGLPVNVLELLAQPLDPKLVSRRKGARGQLVGYIEGHAAIDQANRIFGYGRWGAEVVGPVEYQELVFGGDDPKEHVRVGKYSAVVRVTIAGGPPRSDVGCGFALEQTPDAHDTALKTAVTDGMKRALRQMGQQFGNALYDRASPARLDAARELSDLRSTAVALGSLLGLDEATTKKHAATKAGRAFNTLGAPELAALVRAMAEAAMKRQRAA